MSGQRIEDIATLARSALLSRLSHQDIGALLEQLELVEAAPDDVLATRGSPGGGLSFILDGAARATGNPTGDGELAPGDHFGELTFLTTGRHRSSAKALTALRIARLSRAGFDALAESHPTAALHLTRALLECAAEQLIEPQHAPIVSSAAETPLSPRTWQGRDVYRRTAGLALLEAAARVGYAHLRLGPSITTSRVVDLGPDDDLPSACTRLDAALRQIVREDLPLREEVWKVEDAAEYFRSLGWADAAELLALWHEPTVLLVGCGQVLALHPGPTLSRTGLLQDVCVRLSAGGLLLDFGSVIRRELPEPPQSTQLLEARVPRYGAEMTVQKRRWLEMLGVTSIGHFGRACVTGQVNELIHVSEGFHEKRIALIADEVKARGDVRIIGVAGPSSSGKTTFIKRLKVQLEVNGMHPRGLSLDDYYVDRERSPRGPDGDYDYEALEALDRKLLWEHLTRLLEGRTVRTARFDFRTGKSFAEGGPELHLGDASVLLIEGIHALNPALWGPASGAQTFRVFIHPASSLPYDRLSYFEPADIRLLRRIVRDRHQRGSAAADSLARWPSVRRGERLHIYPYQEYADAVFDSSLVYEPSVLRNYAERYLLEVPRSHPEYAAAQSLRRLLRPFVPIHADRVPPTSILREFIGGSGFTY